MTRDRILLVDDEPLLREAAAIALDAAGFEVLEAGTGDEAAELVENPDGITLVVTDVNMPGHTDGIALGAHTHQHHPDVPVIYVTGHPDSLNRALGCLGSSDTVLQKPFRLSELVGIVHEQLRATD